MNLSLKQKTIVGVALIEAILLILLIMTALKFMRDFNNEAMQKRATTAASLFATATQDALISYDLASLQSLTEQMLQNPDIVYARVMNEAGEVFAESNVGEYGGGTFQADELVTEVFDDIFDVSGEIVVADELYGVVQIGIEISSIQQTLNNLQRNISIIAAVEMGLVALFSYFLGSYLTRQLKKLQLGTQIVSEAACNGNFSGAKISINSNDELADVADAFNRLVDNLKSEFKQRELYEQNLEDLNLSLEQKVKDRTRVLQKQNSLLQLTNQKLQNTQKQLLHAEKMSSIGQLAAGVAHEINNPVGYVLSNLQTMQEYITELEKALDEVECKAAEMTLSRAEMEATRIKYDLSFLFEDSAQLLAESHKGLQKVQGIVSGLKTFSHAGNNEFTAVDINQCVKDTLGMVHNQLKYHCVVESQLCEQAIVNGNEGKICQILTNLLLNAGQAIEANGKIIVRTTRHTNELLVQIADNGVGIAEQHLKMLFDPFFSTKPVGEGTGLGLAISYGIMKDHNGDIQVKSVVNKGTCFTLRFPINAQDALGDSSVSHETVPDESTAKKEVI